LFRFLIWHGDTVAISKNLTVEEFNVFSDDADWGNCGEVRCRREWFVSASIPHSPSSYQGALADFKFNPEYNEKALATKLRLQSVFSMLIVMMMWHHASRLF
jgi:hypothetical protein